MALQPAHLSKAIDDLYLVASRQSVSETEWVEVIKSSDTDAIAGIIARLGSTATTGAKFEALRDSARALLDDRLTTQSVDAMRPLEAAATRLQWVAIGVTAVVGLLTIF